jgi:hypothetical protein
LVLALLIITVANIESLKRGPTSEGEGATNIAKTFSHFWSQTLNLTYIIFEISGEKVTGPLPPLDPPLVLNILMAVIAWYSG